jgi:lipopolysaccharide cholinephosphotransferase
LLDILEEFIRICEKYNLKYCLDGGTMLGAVRHKGFIPWDDDIDVSLPRSDFNKFLEIAKNELNSKYFLQYGTTDSEHYQAYACIRDNQTSAIDMCWIRGGKRYSMGIGIDIFPFDYIPERILDMKWNIWRVEQIFRVYNYVFSRKLRGIRKLLLRPCFILIYKIVGNNRLIRWRDANFASYTEEKATRYGNLVFQVGNERGFFRKHVFRDRIKVSFEYIEAYIPVGYDEYLTQLYGKNWRTPIRGLGSHESLIIDSKQSYKKLLVNRFDYKREWVENLP